MGVPFITWMIFPEPTLIWLVAIPILSALYYYFKKLEQPSKELPEYYIYIVLLGIFSAVLWTKFCVGMLVDCLT